MLLGQPRLPEATREVKGARKKALTENGCECQLTQLTEGLSSASWARRKVLTEILLSLGTAVSLDQL